MKTGKINKTKNKFIQITSYTPIINHRGDWISSGELKCYLSLINREIIVPIHTFTDLASIPKYLRSIFTVNGPHRLAAIVHDYLYRVGGRLPGITLSRETIDKIFLELMLMPRRVVYEGYNAEIKKCIERENLLDFFNSDKPLVTKWKAYLMYYGVKIGGESRFQKINDK